MLRGTHLGLVDGGFKLGRRKRRPGFHRHLWYSIVSTSFRGWYQADIVKKENGCLIKKAVMLQPAKTTRSHGRYNMVWYARVVMGKCRGEIWNVVIPLPCSTPLQGS